MNGWRFAVFLTIVLAVWAAMHVYVFGRLSSVPWVYSLVGRKGLLILGLSFWACYPLARIVDGWSRSQFAWPLEYVGACWVGVLFLFTVSLLFLDVLTLGGWLFSAWAPKLRAGAAFVAVGLSIVAFVQALRSPVVIHHEVRMKGLPPERDGFVIAHLSDLHLGNVLGQRWLRRIVTQVNDLQPDLVMAVGDVIDGNAHSVKSVIPVLREFKAPLGCWAVSGNHEFYAGLEQSLELLAKANFKVLRDSSVEVVSGLVLVGVDDLTARRQQGQRNYSIADLLSARPAGAAVLMSHSPVQTEVAETQGIDLMLSGHTHNGQIWPFTYLVKSAYPLLGGRYEVGRMTVIVCRGTGTWGPRMRLWRPSEIIKITLRSG